MLTYLTYFDIFLTYFDMTMELPGPQGAMAAMGCQAAHCELLLAVPRCCHFSHNAASTSQGCEVVTADCLRSWEMHGFHAFFVQFSKPLQELNWISSFNILYILSNRVSCRTGLIPQRTVPSVPRWSKMIHRTIHTKELVVVTGIHQCTRHQKVHMCSSLCCCDQLLQCDPLWPIGWIWV